MKTHHIYHSYKDYVIVPFLAIEDSFSFTDDKYGQDVIMSDGVRCKVKKWEYIHMCSNYAKTLVQDIYHTDVWNFILRWYSSINISTLTFLYITLEKYD